MVLINSVGVIDSDYYGNPANEGHIFAQMKNITDETVVVEAGERIVQGVFMPSWLLMVTKQLVCVLVALGQQENKV